MSKIICDVCGTRYPDSSEQCPICGCVRGGASNEPVQSVDPVEFDIPERPVVKGGRFSKSNVRKRLKNQELYEEPVTPVAPVKEKQPETKEVAVETDPEEDFEEETEHEGKGGKALNVLLVVVIMALLAVSAYIFLNFFAPNLFDSKQPAPTDPVVVATEAPTEEPTEAPTAEPTEPPYISCEQLVLEITDVVLREAGEMYLLNVQVLPADTQDGIMYISSNESVATVNEEGRVTAVGEGAVVISIYCGDQQLECNVIVDFSEEAPTEAPVEGEGEAATEAPTEAPAQQLKDVKLGVKSNDLTFASGGQEATIKLTCDLKRSEVTWTSEDESIATVSADGVIKRVGTGTTKIIGQYGEQTVEIIVRCPKKK